MKNQDEPLFTQFFVLNTVQEKLDGYTRSLEIKKEIVEIDNQLSHLDLFWLDEQRRTIEGLRKEIETLRGKQSSTVERQGQLKEQIHQLEYVTLPEQCQKLTELEDRISEEFTAEYQEQVGLPRYKQEMARLKRPEAVQKNFSEQLIRSRNEQQTTWSELLGARNNYADRLSLVLFGWMLWIMTNMRWNGQALEESEAAEISRKDQSGSRERLGAVPK